MRIWIDGELVFARVHGVDMVVAKHGGRAEVSVDAAHGLGRQQFADYLLLLQLCGNIVRIADENEDWVPLVRQIVEGPKRSDSNGEREV